MHVHRELAAGWLRLRASPPRGRRCGHEAPRLHLGAASRVRMATQRVRGTSSATLVSVRMRTEIRVPCVRVATTHVIVVHRSSMASRETDRFGVCGM